MLWLFSVQIKLFECCAMDREPVGKIDNTRSPGEDANPTFTSNDNHINMPAETHFLQFCVSPQLGINITRNRWISARSSYPLPVQKVLGISKER